MSYRSSNRAIKGFGLITLDNDQTLDSLKPEFINRGQFTSQTSYGSSETFSSLSALTGSGYQDINETSISGSNLITNNGDGTYTVSSNKIETSDKSMFMFRPSIKISATNTSKDPEVFSFLNEENDSLKGIAKGTYNSSFGPSGPEDCFTFSKKCWITSKSSNTQAYINTNGYTGSRYDIEFTLTSGSALMIWRLL